MSSKKNILIFLNTDYHVETALSIYQTLKFKKYSPVILLDYQIQNGDFELQPFLKKNNIEYLTPEKFDSTVNKNSFHKMIVITAHNNTVKDFNEMSKPPNYNSRMEIFKDKAILIYHRADYLEYLKKVNNYFINPIGISVTQFSQKFGLDYFYQTENPISETKESKTQLNKVRKLLLVGRFALSNRDLHLLKLLADMDYKINKKIKIILTGDKPKDEKKFNFIKNYNLKNIEFDFKFDLNQSDFYQQIIDCDFFLNLVHGAWYFGERFTSNIHHIIAFSKPNLSPFLLNLIYNIPSVTYKKDFTEIFLKTINMQQSEYEGIIKKFKVVKQNLRHHNDLIFDKILE
jgi:hypothetical protein